MPVHAWRNIAKQIEQETDRSKIAELAKELNDAMIAEERAIVKIRLGIGPPAHNSPLYKPTRRP